MAYFLPMVNTEETSINLCCVVLALVYSVKQGYLRLQTFISVLVFQEVQTPSLPLSEPPAQAVM